jgi:hypothetical protein
MLKNAKKKKKTMSVLQLQFQNEVKTQRKVMFIQTRVYHTQNNALHKKTHTANTKLTGKWLCANS